MCCLINICWRYNAKDGHARPGINRIASDTGFKRRTIIAAVKRLAEARLISREKGTGRGRTTRYRLPWLPIHLADPSSDDPIIWNRGGRGAELSEKVQQNAPFHPEKRATQCTLSPRKGACQRRKGCNPRSERVHQHAPEKNKRIKGGQDQVAPPISDAEVHKIATECIKAGIGSCDWVDITMKADDLGYTISNDYFEEIYRQIRDRRKE